MRITVIGAGGVGGYFGARLSQGGNDVAFIARGEHLKALRSQGLVVESSLGEIRLPRVRASDNPAELGVPDVILMCVKLWDTEAVARAALPIVGPNTAVISLQNGVQKDQVLQAILGKRPVLGGVCYISSRIARPGCIQHIGSIQKLVFGEYDGSTSGRVEAFLSACKQSGIEAEISSDIHRVIWEKFVFLVGLSATTTAMQETIGRIRSNPQTRAFLLDVMREVVAVGRAHGIRIDEQYAENRAQFVDSLPTDMTSSMYNDLMQKKRLEVTWLSGGVVELGRVVGIDTPLNRAVNDILALHADG